MKNKNKRVFNNIQSQAAKMLKNRNNNDTVQWSTAQSLTFFSPNG